MRIRCGKRICDPFIVKTGGVDNSSGTVQNMHKQFDSHREDFFEEKDEDSGFEGAESEGKADSQKEFSVMATTMRNHFYAFHKATEKYDTYLDSIFQSLHKNLTIKIPKILDHHALSDYFERQLFKLAKNPRQIRKNWSEEENLLLVSVVAFYCILHNEDSCSIDDDAWNYIASIYPGKKADHLKTRWQTIYKMTLNKAPWSAAEDDLLLTIIKEKGPQHWKEIALELSKRSNYGIHRQGKQCRERWINHLDPNVKKGSWTEQEDLSLLKLFLELGKRWSCISKRLGGRTENNVKNRWISLMRKYKSDFSFEGGVDDLENEETSNWEEKVANAVIRLRSQEISAKNCSKQNLNYINDHHSAENHSILSSNEDFEVLPVSKKVSEVNSTSKYSDLNGNVQSAESIKQKLSKLSAATNARPLQQPKQTKEFHPAADMGYTHHNNQNEEQHKVLSAMPHQSNPLQGMRIQQVQQQPQMQLPHPQQFIHTQQQLQHISKFPLQYIPHGQQMPNGLQIPNGLQLLGATQKYAQLPLQGYNPQPQLKELQKPPVQYIHTNGLAQNLTTHKSQEIQKQTSEKSNEDELYHLAEKKMDRVPLEAQPDKDFLYFAVIDTKTHEIYVMNQVTQANYGQTLDALSAEKQEEQDELVPNSSQPNLDYALSQEPEFPEYTFSRKTSDFLFEDK